MEKKTVQIMAVLIAAGFFIYLMVSLNTFNLFSVFFPGFTVTSISTTGVISNDQDLNSEWFLVDTVLNAGGQNVVGTITPGQFNQESGYETQFPLEINIKTQDEKATYNIRNDGASIYKYSTVTVNCGFLECSNLNWDEKCPSFADPEFIMVEGSFLGISKVHCIEKEQVAVKGSFENPQVDFQATIGLDVNGKTIEKTVTNRDTSVNFYDGGVLRATAQWTGSLVTGSSPPNQDNYVAVWNYIRDRWSVASKQKYDDYIQQGNIDSDIRAVSSSPGNFPDVRTSQTLESIFTTMSEFSGVADRLVKAEDSFSFNPTADYENRGDINKGSIFVTLDRKLLNPSILFKVKADWLGVKILTTDPKIESLSCPDFFSGNPGVIQVDVRNKGESGSFSYSVSNCDPIIQSSSSSNIPIGKNERKSFNIPISAGQSAQDIRKTCSVRVYDFNNPSNEDIRTVSCKAKAPQTCEPGKEILSGNCIEVCKADGTGFDKSRETCCEFGIDYNDATQSYECRPKIDKPSIVPVSLIFGSVGALLTFLIVGGDGLRKKDWVDITIGLLVGILIGVLIWWLLENLLAIGIIGGLLAILGGTALYFFGGVFVTIAVVIGLIVKGLKG